MDRSVGRRGDSEGHVYRATRTSKRHISVRPCHHPLRRRTPPRGHFGLMWGSSPLEPISKFKSARLCRPSLPSVISHTQTADKTYSRIHPATRRATTAHLLTRFHGSLGFSALPRPTAPTRAHHRVRPHVMSSMFQVAAGRGCAVCEVFRLIAFRFSQRCSPMIKVGEWSMPPYPAKLFYTWLDEIRIDAVNRRVARLMPRVFVHFIIQLVRKVSEW